MFDLVTESLREIGHFLQGPLAKVLVGVILGWVMSKIGRAIKLRKERTSIEKGQQFDTVEFVKVYLTDSPNKGKFRLHVELLGTLPISTFITKEAVRRTLLSLTEQSAADQLRSVIPMVGRLGSFVLRELLALLMNIVKQNPNLPEAEKWVMFAALETYKPIDYIAPTAVLVRRKDLLRFSDLGFAFSQVEVLYSTDAAKILTLIEAAAKYREQHEAIRTARASGKSTRYMEQMFRVPLKLDTYDIVPDPEEVALGEDRAFGPPPWDRFHEDLAGLGLHKFLEQALYPETETAGVS